MHAAAERSEFVPTPLPGLVRGVLLAVLAHGLLIAALTWGLRWNREPEKAVAFEAELWSAMPTQAAPPEAAPPPPPTPEPQTRPEPPAPTEADIALEKERRAREVREKARQRELEKEKEREKEKARKEAELKKREKEKEKKVAEDKRRKASDARKAEDEKSAKELEKQRKANLERMARGLAGATGGENSTGSGLQSSGPSAGYGARIVARVKPNIVFPDVVSGNPSAEVEVRAAPDGTILSRRLVKASGVKAWDDAVLKAIDKTETLPRDTDGRVPSSLVITFRPKD